MHKSSSIPHEVFGSQEILFLGSISSYYGCNFPSMYSLSTFNNSHKISYQINESCEVSMMVVLNFVFISNFVIRRPKFPFFTNRINVIP